MSGVLDKEYSHMLANSIDHKQTIEHQERLNLIISEQELLFVKTFNLIPFRNGEKWCVILGKGTTGEIIGSGDSPLKAIIDFNKKFTKG